MIEIRSIIERAGHSKEDLITLLRSEGDDKDILFKKTGEIRDKHAGKKVWLRGLIEFSNIC
jgi:biotin synthase